MALADYTNRPQSAGRIICEDCKKGMLSPDEVRKNAHFYTVPEMVGWESFCQCPPRDQLRAIAGHETKKE